ncbi:hypothetical protein, partial [Zunongwangia sp.]|uniref:hypothetical protein n=1 Tax=Zunongwangia sp. TaxID=1965325 RepID=UPI003AA7EA12
DDIVFVKIKTGKDISSIFQLISKNIDCFKVESKKFKRLEKDSGEGFYEEIFKNDKLFLFKKYQKKEFRRLDKNYVYYEYYSDKPLFFLRTKGILHSFNSKKEVISLYPDKKKEIRRFYKQYKQLLKDNPDSFAKNLLNSLL